jgi:hypothetical protein
VLPLLAQQQVEPQPMVAVLLPLAQQPVEPHLTVAVLLLLAQQPVELHLMEALVEQELLEAQQLSQLVSSSRSVTSRTMEASATGDSY